MRKLRPLEVLTLGLTYKGRSPALASAQPPTPPPSQLSHGGKRAEDAIGFASEQSDQLSRVHSEGKSSFLQSFQSR